MPDSVKNSNEVSHESIGKDSEVLKDAPKAAPRASTPKKNDGDGESRSEDSLNPFDGLEDETVSANGGAEHIYAKVNRKTKSQEENLDSGVSSTPPLYSDVLSTPPRRSDSVGSEKSSVYSTPLESSKETMRGLTENFDGTFSYGSHTPSTTTDDSNRPLIPDDGSGGSVSITGKNRFWTIVSDVVKKKKFVIPIMHPIN